MKHSVNNQFASIPVPMIRKQFSDYYTHVWQVRN